MKLKYRGVSYETIPTQIEIVGKKNQVMFRGCSYTLSGAVINLPKNSNKDITYRGVSMNDNQKKRFMGRTYESPKVCLTPVMA